jgi:polyisoprenoid-binding protein YceI
MRFTKFFVAISVLVFLAANGFAAEKYEIDAVHSNVGFTVRHMLVAKVSGKFKEFSGTIIYDEKDITKSSVNVTIKTASIDTDNERRDGHLRSADFFDVENHPEITFASKKIEKRGDGYVAIGDLTIRGATKQIELPFQILGILKEAKGNSRIGIEAGATLNRFDYGVKWDRKLDTGGLVVGENVEINLTVEAVFQKPQAGE